MLSQQTITLMRDLRKLGDYQEVQQRLANKGVRVSTQTIKNVGAGFRNNQDIEDELVDFYADRIKANAAREASIHIKFQMALDEGKQMAYAI